MNPWGPSPYPAGGLSAMYEGPMQGPERPVQWGGLAGFMGPRPSGFVDQVDNGVAAIIDPETGRVIYTDASTLPGGAGEGQWVRDRMAAPAPPSNAAALRARLSAADRGGPIKL